MTERTHLSNRNEFTRILPGILVSLGALVVIFIIVDWHEVLTALRQADYKYLLLGIPIYLIAYFFRALAWRTLLKEEASIKKVFLIMQAGYLLNNVLPLRLGELGRAFLLGRTGLGFWRVLSTILIERAFDMILAAGLVLGTLPFVWNSPQSQQVASMVGGLVLIGLIALHFLARYRVWAVATFQKFSNRWTVLARFGVERLEAFFNGLSALVQTTRFIRVLLWMLTSWGLAVVYQYILLLAFEPGAHLLWAAFGVGTASLGVALPSTPSYVGVLEAVWIGVLALFGVPFSTALAYALTAHVLHILISCVFGIYALSQEGETLRQVYTEIRNRRFV
jgi:uncharacterized protein (TIRG00374 family)